MFILWLTFYFGINVGMREGSDMQLARQTKHYILHLIMFTHSFFTLSNRLGCFSEKHNYSNRNFKKSGLNLYTHTNKKTLVM